MRTYLINEGRLDEWGRLSLQQATSTLIGGSIDRQGIEAWWIEKIVFTISHLYARKRHNWWKIKAWWINAYITSSKMKCSACGEEGCRRNSKKCRLYDPANQQSRKAPTCSACGEEGCRRNSRKCPLYDPSRTQTNKTGGKKIYNDGIVLQGQNWNPCWWMMMIVGSISPCRLKNYRSFDHHSKNTPRTDSRNTL